MDDFNGPLDPSTNIKEFPDNSIEDKTSSEDLVKKLKDNKTFIIDNQKSLETQLARLRYRESTLNNIWKSNRRKLPFESRIQGDNAYPSLSSRQPIPDNASDEEVALRKIHKAQDLCLILLFRMNLIKQSDIIVPKMRSAQKNIDKASEIYRDLDTTANNIAKGAQENKDIRSILAARNEYVTDDLSSLNMEMPEYFGPESD